jgi:hypothetical protein
MDEFLVIYSYDLTTTVYGIVSTVVLAAYAAVVLDLTTRVAEPRLIERGEIRVG